MMSSKKRKSPITNSPPSNNKVPKKETCPHGEKCYRRNPHHFREYDHPHLEKFMEDDAEIPDGLSQPKQVYIEQIEVLKSLKPLPSERYKRENTENCSLTNEKKNSTVVSPSPIVPKNPFLKKETASRAVASSSRSKVINYFSTKLDEKDSTAIIGNSVNVKTDGKRATASSASVTKNLSENCIDLTDAAGGINVPGISSSKKQLQNFCGDDFSRCPPGSMMEKLKNAAPYNIFFTTIPKSPSTLKEPNAVTFTDLLCPSLGKLACSLQMNFMIDIMWLMQQYKARQLHKKPATILYGDEFPDMPEFIRKFLPNVTYHHVKMKDPFGTHHSKIGVYVYEDNSLRVVVSTANLYYEDWNHYNQGLWLSPNCPRLPEGSALDGESPTGFKMSLINYLQKYEVACLREWIDRIKMADFSAVRVFLVTSCPGKHYPKNNQGSHLHRVGDLLTRHCSLPVKTTPGSEGPLDWGIIAQASSIGSLGKAPADWLRSCLLRSLAGHTKGPLTSSSNATISVIYPTVDNVMTGYFGPESGGCLPYAKATNEKQRWFQDYLHQWKADRLQRTRAMPHIKSYCRVSPCLNKLAYYLLTSSNISKSAWGGNIQKDSGNYVRSYEVGVLFLPKFFDEEYFEINNTLNKKNKQLFPFMYDLPLTSYRSDDYPWCN